ncbi:hypothetical protein [Microbacterium sp. SS28]|uniref:hypothetical protein n=1 Tax=Microbacterium sp. SS28 TaxID=2919948 RepID=UPI001FAAA326|nr:hypothetical protein [Microbacterium sp. SS28]
MPQIPLALCDKPRGAHVLARLVAHEGKVAVEFAAAIPAPTKRTDLPRRRLSIQSAAWGTLAVESEVFQSSSTILFCAPCRRGYVLEFDDLDINGRVPIVLAREPNL